jgi:hypothetical protein
MTDVSVAREGSGEGGPVCSTPWAPPRRGDPPAPARKGRQARRCSKRGATMAPTAARSGLCPAHGKRAVREKVVGVELNEEQGWRWMLTGGRSRKRRPAWGRGWHGAAPARFPDENRDGGGARESVGTIGNEWLLRPIGRERDGWCGGQASGGGAGGTVTR